MYNKYESIDDYAYLSAAYIRLAVESESEEVVNIYPNHVAGEIVR